MLNPSGETTNQGVGTREASVLSFLGSQSDGIAELQIDLEAVEENLNKGLRSSLSLPKDLAKHVVMAGGKRIRPYLMCSTFRACQNLKKFQPRASLDDLHTLAAVAEWVHTATLFHDDVLDASVTRRGIPAAQVLEGNKVAILVGDFVYVEAFALLMERGLLAPSRDLAHTIKKLVEGELLQHKEVQNRGLSLENYEKIAFAKTAALFEWCSLTGAWAAGFEDLNLARNLGSQLGYAFQLIDDVIDCFEFDPRKESPEKILEWIESSAPFPIVCLHQVEKSFTQEKWTMLGQADLDLDSQRFLILELQSKAKSPDCAKLIQQTISKSLLDAEKTIVGLGSDETLFCALDIIKTRAESAYSSMET